MQKQNLAGKLKKINTVKVHDLKIVKNEEGIEYKVRIGSDIEIFLFDTIKNEYHSIIGYINAGKLNPLPLDREGCSIQEDNVNLEYNVSVTTDPKHMYEDIKYVLENVKLYLPDHIVTKIGSSALFPDNQLIHPASKQAGCTPDYNAWKNGKMNKAPKLNKTNLRTTGAHLHCDIEENLMIRSLDFVKALDFFLGIPSLLLDSDTKRRELYGKAGCFRPTTFGIEYRVLSNFWTANLELVEWAFTGVNKAMNFIKSGVTLKELLFEAGINEKESCIEKIINENQIDKAEIICSYFKMLPKTY